MYMKRSFLERPYEASLISLGRRSELAEVGSSCTSMSAVKLDNHATLIIRIIMERGPNRGLLVYAILTRYHGLQSRDIFDLLYLIKSLTNNIGISTAYSLVINSPTMTLWILQTLKTGNISDGQSKNNIYTKYH
jgi:hypothetical protein